MLSLSVEERALKKGKLLKSTEHEMSGGWEQGTEKSTRKMLMSTMVQHELYHECYFVTRTVFYAIMLSYFETV